MEDLIPGLVKVMEERLGRSGRPVTTLFVVLVMFGISAWMIGLINSHIVGPASRALRPVFQGRPINAIDGLVPLGISVLVAILALIVIWMLSRKVRELSLRSTAAGRLASSTYQRTEELESQLQKAQGEFSNTSRSTGEMLANVVGILKDYGDMLVRMQGSLSKLEERVGRLEPPNPHTFSDYLRQIKP